MIEYNNEKNGSSLHDSTKIAPSRQARTPPPATSSAIVCPACYMQIDEPTIMADGADEFGRRLRTYFGYCHKCRAAHVVIQFKREERWVIHKYRPAVVLGTANIIHISDNWRLMSELPPPAPVMLGPGGDFKKPYSPELIDFAEKLRSMRDAFSDLVENIDEWLNDNTK